MQKRFICLIITLFLSWNVQAGLPAEITLQAGLKLTPQSQHLASEVSKYKIDVDYPQLDGSALNAAGKQFNQIVNNIISTQITDFKVRIVDNSAYVKNLPPEVSQNSLLTNYTATVLTAGESHIISIKLNNEIMYAGGAHPVHTIQIVNFDLNTGKEIKLDELFKPRSEYLQLLSTYARQDLIHKIKTTDQKGFDAGTAPLPENYLNWNLEASGIRITFNEDQVAANVFGQPEVMIPYGILQDVIQANAPIASCLKTPTACAAQQS